MPNSHVQEESLAVSFDVQFWGVRNQIATPGKDTVRYGGNTSCVEMRIGEARLIFDGGTGLRALGNSLLSQMPVEAHMFFTHCHWDRIQGFPFFVPAFIPINHFHIYGAEASNGSTFKQRLSGQMLGPNFPVPIQVMQSKLEFHDIHWQDKCLVGEDIVIETYILNREHRSIGYRVISQGKCVVYAMTPDYFTEKHHSNWLDLIRQADLLLLAAPENIPQFHSPPKPEELNNPVEGFWEKGIKVAQELGVKQVIMSLHHPEHNDDYLDLMESKMQQSFPKATFAKEGMIISLS
ncbi:MBL fold metallo-hydrolase [Spirulina subsalsa FACHB-351]|uniref:MBL fold metallo-hydrolase n=1 Tax=Spirulina subsalsa FACHB-351 TaxID=234711 RepID=A0ABT3L4A0_9CYAN|nr:MBL fold metallo-hydrolase [Spirulina subsalsa FACHB-351]